VRKYEKMEITLEAIISLVGLFVGGGGGAFFTWRYMRKKAKAEAQQAEVDAAKDMQELYKKMLTDANEYLEDARTKVEGLRQERDHYKQERDDMRHNVEKLTKLYYELKTEGEKERSILRVSIQQLRGQMRNMSPLTCSVLQCKLRQLVIISEDSAVSPAEQAPATKTDVKPIETEAL
jgi:chromosome segregation ATPase